jgi:hypothetical protein
VLLGVAIIGWGIVGSVLTLFASFWPAVWCVFLGLAAILTFGSIWCILALETLPDNIDKHAERQEIYQRTLDTVVNG